MPSIADIKQQFPNFADLDDEQVVDAVHQSFYPEMDRAKIASDLGVKAPEAPEPSAAKRVISDGYKALKKGVEGLPGAATGLADIPFALAVGARPFTKAADKLGEMTGFQPGKWAEDIQFSKTNQKSSKDIEDKYDPVEAAVINPDKTKADVALELIKATPGMALEYAKNPAYTLNQVLESLPAMFAGGGISRKLLEVGAKVLGLDAAGPALPGILERLVGQKAAVPIAGGVGEGAVQAGQLMDQSKGTDQRNNALAALGSGGIDAVIGAGAGRVAHALGLETAETAMAGGAKRAGIAAEAGAPMSAARRIAGGAASEGILQETPQSWQEAGFQNWAEGKPIGEGAAQQAIEGGLAGGVMGAGANMRGGHDAAPVATDTEAPPGSAPVPGAPAPGNSPQIPPSAGTVPSSPATDAAGNSPSVPFPPVGVAPPPVTGALSKAANIAAAQGNPQPVKPDEAPLPPDPVLDRINALPADQQAEAHAAYENIKHPDTDSGTTQYNKKILDEHLSRAETQATEENDPVAQLDRAETAIKSIARTTDPEERGPFATAEEAHQYIAEQSRNASFQVHALPIEYPDGSHGVAVKGSKDYPEAESQLVSRKNINDGVQEGDLLSASGRPFLARLPASREAKATGGEVIDLGDKKGWVVRPKIEAPEAKKAEAKPAPRPAKPAEEAINTVADKKPATVTDKPTAKPAAQAETPKAAPVKTEAAGQAITESQKTPETPKTANLGEKQAEKAQKAPETVSSTKKGTPTKSTAETVDIKAAAAKMIPDMTDAELLALVDHYGTGNHRRVEKIKAAIEKRGLTRGANAIASLDKPASPDVPHETSAEKTEKTEKAGFTPDVKSAKPATESIADKSEPAKATTDGNEYKAENQSDKDNFRKASAEAAEQFKDATPAMHLTEADRIEAAAKKMGKLPDVVRRYKALAQTHRDLATAKQALSDKPAADTGPIGQDNIPLSEGGKPFKTSKAAQDARKLNKTMRVSRVEGGFALKPASDAQLAAADQAARKMALPKTSPAGEPIPAHAMIAANGGLDPKEKGDMGMDRNVRIGNRFLFGQAGTAMTIERATEKLVEEGYLQEGATHNQAYSLIKRSLSDPQYTPEGVEHFAEKEKQAQFEAAQAEPEAIAQIESLDDNQFDILDDALPDADTSSQTTTAEAMRAMGFSEQEISDELTQESRGSQGTRQGDGSDHESAGAQAENHHGDGENTPHQDSSSGRQENGLTSPTPADILAQQDRAEAGEKSTAAKKKADDLLLKKEQERKDIAAASVKAAARFTLGGNAEDALSGQDGMFAEQPEPALAPSMADSKVISDVGQKLGGARKDMAPSLSRELTDETIAKEPFSKIWPAEEVDAIKDPFIAAMAHTARDSVPAKPRVTYKLKSWVEKVKIVRDLASKISNGSITKEDFKDKLGSYRSLQKFQAKVALLEGLDRATWKRIGEVQENPDAYMYDQAGQKVMRPSVYVNIDGKHTSFEGSKSVADVIEQVSAKLGGDAPVKKMQFEVRGRVSAGFNINKKGDPEKRKLKSFPTAKEAFEFIEKNHAEAVAAWEAVKESDNVKEGDVRGESNRQRTGNDYRQGKDVSADKFRESFGFRGVEFGNWVTQGANAKDRQGMINQAYDALMDLSEIISVPAKALSLNGTLGLGFGSRGSGTASAHFEPDTLVINLTKTKGAGVLAHEWFHALDNYFAHQRGGEVKIKRGVLNAQTAYRMQNYITYKPEPMFVHKTQSSTPMTLARLEQMRAQNPKASYYNADQWQIDPSHPTGVRTEVERAFADLVSMLDASPMAARAEKNDKAPEGYWSRIIERAARSFENYIISKMQEQGFDNDYLANVRSADEFSRAKDRYPYLLPEEVKPVAEAFDTLFSTIKTKETEDGNVLMYSPGHAPATEPFFSALAKGVEGINAKALTPALWKDAIKGLLNKGAIKPDEVQWSGVTEWLDLQEGKVTKQQVSDYLAGNGVKVTETQLGGPIREDAKGIQARREIFDKYEPEIQAIYQALDADKTPDVVGQLSESDRLMGEMRKIQDKRNAEADAAYKLPDHNPTKYQKYQLPGGTNYREVLLTLPEKTGTPIEEGLAAKYGKQGKSLWNAATEDERAAWKRETDSKSITGKGGYKSSHWEQPNILAHIRLNDRTDASGAKVLFVEEIQSDWAQQGKKEGFGAALPRYTVRDANGNMRGDFATRAEAQAYLDKPPEHMRHLFDHTARIVEAAGPPGIPSAPFVGKTDAWVALAIKRVIKMAVDEGYDRVAFVNGEQSAERYSLAKQVDSLTVKDKMKSMGEPGLFVIAEKDGRNVIERTVKDENELASLVGKEVARKILEQPMRGGEQRLEGLDLKVGGEGMKAFYEKIVPSVAKDVVRKLGGDGLSTVKIGEGESQQSAFTGEPTGEFDSYLYQPGFDITPAMREKAADGVPMFSPAKVESAASTAATAQNKAMVNLWVKAMVKGWSNAPEVVVASSMQDPAIPAAIRAKDQQQRSTGKGGDPEGFFSGGKVYLFASQLKTPQDIARVMAHESLGHYGLRGMYGDALKPILSQIANVRGADINKKIADYAKRGVTNLDRLTAAEEVLAEMAEKQPNLGFVQRAIAAIRTWLRAHGFKDLALTDDELIRSYLIPARDWVMGEQADAPVHADTMYSPGTSQFAKWFGKSKVVDAAGKPLVVYHGSARTFTEFDGDKSEGLHWFTPSKSAAQSYGDRLMDTYLSIKNPLDLRNLKTAEAMLREISPDIDPDAGIGKIGVMIGVTYAQPQVREWAIARGYDGLIVPTAINSDSMKLSSKPAYIAFEPTQIKSATGNNGEYSPTNPDINYSLSKTLNNAANNARDLNLPASYKVGDFFNTHANNKTLGWWHKTFGTQYNLAQQDHHFKRVYDGIQNFLNDVSYYATKAADLAPNILPKLDTWKDVLKTPLTAADNKAIAAPIFEGTLTWTRDEEGNLMSMKDREAQAGALDVHEKAHKLLKDGKIQEFNLQMWRGLPIEQYENIVNGKYESEYLKAGAVFTPQELRGKFKLNDKQIGLYTEFRAATDKSLTQLGLSDLVRYGGKDLAPIKDQIMEAPNITVASELARDYLMSLATGSDRNDVLLDMAGKMIEKGDRVKDLQDRGYAPLSRFGTHSLDVLDKAGNRIYFGLFESKAEANMMARKMVSMNPGATVTRGTTSEQAHKLFAGVSPETMELFGEMLGLESQGSDAASKAFQEYIKLARSSRSAMKRLIERKGTAGFNEDPGRVLAGFIYSNSRHASAGLHMGEIEEAAKDIPQGKGQIKDAAIKLKEYVQNPQDEATNIKGLLFTQYLGGSVASAIVNMTQPFTMSFPYLSQYGGIAKAASQMAKASADMMKKSTGDRVLDAALKKAEEEGIVAPQEVHQLMAQANGAGALKSGDGTTAGNATAGVANKAKKLAFVWGKVFSSAEQFNRRLTFIAAYRTAIEQKIADPYHFATEAINATQGVYNKGNKPAWARGAIGGTLFTFKQYGISFVELTYRMATQGGPEGKKAALLMLGVLFLIGGGGGLPFEQDIEDVIDAAMQRLGYNWSTKQRRNAFIAEMMGQDVASFLDNGISGIAGVPIDVSGRMGMGNLIPGTGLLTKKKDHTSDILELAGPAGDLAKRGFQAANSLALGEPVKAAKTLLPTAAQNLLKSYDMANTGIYKDQAGKRVMDVDGYDALAKGIGFQPNNVARYQESQRDIQNMVGQHRLRQAEISDKWALGKFNNDPDMIAEAKDELKTWNENNPNEKITVSLPGIISRVKKMKETKAQRIASSAPKNLRASIKRELATSSE